MELGNVVKTSVYGGRLCLHSESRVLGSQYLHYWDLGTKAGKKEVRLSVRTKQLIESKYLEVQAE